jgi:hypothetical protein
MPKRLQETTPLSEAGTSTAKSGRMSVVAISAGLGSTGYYSPEVIREAATNQLIKQGTPLFLDHPSESDRHDRPERSVRDIAAVFTGAATYDEAEEALVGEIQVFAPYRDLLTEMGPHIGLSISGSATDITEGEHDGRRVPVVEGLAAIDSVDFVTRAGRGGRIVDLLESVRANHRAVANGVSEATVNDTREALQNALRDTYPSPDGMNHWIWVRDFDDTTVWFEVEGGDDAGIYGQTYTEADGAVALTGTRTEVRVVTTYVPATRPDSNTTTESQKENPMGTIQIEETEHRSLVEKAGRVDTLESERDTAVTERDQLRTERDQLRAREAATTHARTRVTTANASLPTSTVDRIVEAATRTVPLTESGQLDTVALDTAVDTARTTEETYLAGLAEAAGLGTVTGFGGKPAGDQPTLTESDLDAACGGAFGRQVKEA